MSLISEKVNYSLFESLLSKFIMYGPVPKHIAFIMDGNRRYAAAKGFQKLDGHKSGFKKLSQVVTWCKDLGIKELSVYAFSIANFNRSKEEVDYLFTLAEEKFKQLLDSLDSINKQKLCIRIIGQLDLLPEKLRTLSYQIIESTRQNSSAFLNIYMSYTSGYEISSNMNAIRLGLEKNELKPEDINEDLLNECIASSNTYPVDLLIRTSGEVRLSDFLSWQVSRSNSVYEFTSVNWPSFTFYHFLAGIFHYQLHHTQNFKPAKRQLSARGLRFVENLKEKHLTGKSNSLIPVILD